MNVFEMYEANGNRAGFWIVRDSWGYTCARVVLIGDQVEGPLSPEWGRPPYYNGARDLVYAEIYRLVAGELQRELKPFNPAPGHPDLTVLSCPGSYAYTLLAAAPAEIALAS